MLGRVLSLIKWAVIAAIALAVGAQLLRSASVVVLSIRGGNPLPLVLVAGFSFGLQRISGHYSGTRHKPGITSTLLDVIAYSSTAYLFVIVFLAASVFGIIAAVACSGVTILAVQLVRDPVGLHSRMESLSRAGYKLGIDIAMPGTGSMNSEQMWRRVSQSRMRVLRIPDDARGTVVDILRERPLLPLSFTHLEGGLFLVVSNKDGEDWVPRIIELLEQSGVRGALPVSALLQEAVLGLPLLESTYGIALSEYVIAVDKSTIDKLIGMWPRRMTVYPDPNGLRVVVRTTDAAGMNTLKIPRGCELSVVVERDLSLPVEEVAESEA